ncbi:cell division protein FtsZ [Sphingomonas sp. AR_OL41]|uniref:cell division protein FtsZ n=1 Tax=Sphingomonas sp. AR_OL41 TaxID=3042729 RepID=UPI002481015A|nr:cell division protein FtsZ [Sphingomonas sp. AR_OL41]MDH7974985.1 cell division protein FtsZ [Sphingomonas sp. AR_OL41]
MAQAQDEDSGVTIVGVGGAGGNAVAELFWQRRHGLRLLCANTDRQALDGIDARHRLQLGRRLTGGLGAGADPEIGRRAAEEAMPEIVAALTGTRLCIIAAGLGGGTGTGAAPVVARAAHAIGAVTVGIAIKPFAFEGRRRARVADAGAAALAQACDALVTVCNEHLFRVASYGTTMRDALAASNAVVSESAAGFARLAAGDALKRVGAADLCALLAEGGRTVIGHGESRRGADRAVRAARAALRNPLLESVLGSAQRLLVSISGGSDLGLFEVEEAIAWLRDQAEPTAEIMWSATTDAALDGCVRIGIVATRLVASTRAATAPHGAVCNPVPALPLPEVVAPSAVQPAPPVLPVAPWRAIPPRSPGAAQTIVHDIARIIPARRHDASIADILDLDATLRLPDRALVGAGHFRPFDRVRQAIREVSRGARRSGDAQAA